MCFNCLFSERVVAAILFILIFLSSLFQKISQPFLKTTTTSSFVQEAKVIKVFDGDTIQLENGKIVRYIGIDAPELHHPKKILQCFAKEAAQYNRQLVEGKTVRLKKDVSETDKYGRLLRYVFLINQKATAEAVFVNKKLVAEGYAYAATYPPDISYAGVFLQAQKEAQKEKKGLWKKCKNLY